MGNALKEGHDERNRTSCPLNRIYARSYFCTPPGFIYNERLRNECLRNERLRNEHVCDILSV